MSWAVGVKGRNRWETGKMKISYMTDLRCNASAESEFPGTREPVEISESKFSRSQVLFVISYQYNPTHRRSQTEVAWTERHRLLYQNFIQQESAYPSAGELEFHFIKFLAQCKLRMLSENAYQPLRKRMPYGVEDIVYLPLLQGAPQLPPVSRRSDSRTSRH